MRWTTRLVCCILFAAPSLAFAQGPGGYPNHQVKVIVPFAAGGPTDVMARLIARKLSENLGQQFYVENHAGAGGNIGMVAAARAASDGYTVLFVSSSFVVNPNLYAKKPYDPFKDFAPVTRAAATPNIVVVNPSVGAKTLKELVDLVKANPGKYSIAHAGIGTTPHLAGELLKLTFKLDVALVPFNGGAPAVQSTLAGHTPITLTALPPASPFVADGKLRGLAVTGAKRSAALPQVPTMAEAGVDEQESETMQGVLVPAGTPQAIVDFLNAEIVKVMTLPDVRTKCQALGFEPVADRPEHFAAYIKADVEKWSRVIKDARIPLIQ